MYKGYKLVGQFPQFDAWELNDDGEAVELLNEYARYDDPAWVEVWSVNPDYPDEWIFENDFEGQHFADVDEAKAAIDKL